MSFKLYLCNIGYSGTASVPDTLVNLGTESGPTYILILLLVKLFKVDSEVI